MHRESPEVAKQLNVSISTVKVWRGHGLLKAHLFNDKNERLYEPPGEDAPRKQQGQKLAERPRLDQFLPNPAHEVQYEA